MPQELDPRIIDYFDDKTLVVYARKMADKLRPENPMISKSFEVLANRLEKAIAK